MSKVLAIFCRIGVAWMFTALLANPVRATEIDARVIGYYASWTANAPRSFLPEQVQAKLLTHINFAFAKITDGRVSIDESDRKNSDADLLRRLVLLKQQNPRLQILLSVGGWTGSVGFSEAASTQDGRSRFASSAMRLIEKYQLDGVDIDWEFPVAGGDPGTTHRPEDRENYTKLLRELRLQLRSSDNKEHKSYLLTAAFGNNPSFVRNTEMHELAALLDWANLMAYDFTGPWNLESGHHAPLRDDPADHGSDHHSDYNISSLVGNMIAAGFRARQLVLGIPFYGYSWSGCQNLLSEQYGPCLNKGPGSWEPSTLDYSDIETKYLHNNAYQLQWNDVAQATSLYSQVERTFISFDDQRSLSAKMQYLREQGLAGAMIWEMAGDRRGTLLKTIAAALH